MKKSILSIAISLTIFTSFAQTSESIIEVIGVGKILSQPDKGVLVMNLSTIQMEFGATIDSLTSKRNKLFNQIQNLGYNKDNIKSRQYSIRENEIYRRTKPSYDSGFIGTQTLLLEFENSENTIATLIKSFSQSKVDVRLNFNFILSDKQKESLKAQIIEKAIDDANTKAQIIAKKSGYKLGRIIEIVYGNVPDRYLSINQDFEEMIDVPMTHQPPNFAIGFAVQEITLSDRVLIKYELK